MEGELLIIFCRGRDDSLPFSGAEGTRLLLVREGVRVYCLCRRVVLDCCWSEHNEIPVLDVAGLGDPGLKIYVCRLFCVYIF